MAYTAITQPHEYMAAYSAVPLKLYDTDYNVSENYKYIANITWDKVSITGHTPYIIYNDVLTKLTSTTPHNFSLGDYLFLNDSNNGDVYTGYYIIRKIASTTEFVVDLTPTQPFGVSAFATSRFIKYKFNPDLDGYAKMDLSNVLKDFVSENLTGQTVDYSLSYPGTDTRFCYELVCGSEKQYRQPFLDNLFSGGSLCFINSGITSLNDTEFVVGDQIFIQQDLYEWAYLDNVFDGSYVGFTGTTQPPFNVGSQVTVTGQETFPYYNGITTVFSSGASPNIVVVEKFWQGSTPVEPGSIFGVPRPEYNGTCVIIGMFIHPTYGLVIITDKSFTTASPVLPGFITFADNRLTTIPNEIVISGLCVYNSHINLPDYTITAFDPYVIQNRSFDENFLSTIFEPGKTYRVEPSTIGFILTHLEDTALVLGMGYEFYNSNGGTLGQLLITGMTEEDYYSPIGLEQIGGLTQTQDFGIPFSGYVNDINSYCIYAADVCGCNAICITLEYKPGSGTTTTQCVVKEDDLINGKPAFLVDVVYTGTTYPSQLSYIIDPFNINNDGWYLQSVIGATTYQQVTGFTWMFDKNNATDCAASTTWSSPVGSPVKGGVGVGSFVVANNLGCITQYSNQICFELNKDCSKYEIYHIIWKDKLGSFISYPFIYVSRDNMEVDRKGYYKQNGTWKNNTFGYDEYGAGETDFYVRSRKSIIVNSGWLYEFERDLMEDLIQSPSMYLQTPDNRLFAGGVEEKKIEVYKQVNDDIFSYSFNFVFANNEVRF
jgi:hypothetical protein